MRGIRPKCTQAQSIWVSTPVPSHPWSSPTSLYFGNPQAHQTRSGRTLLKTLPKTRFPVSCPGTRPNKPVWWPCRERPREAFWRRHPPIKPHWWPPSVLSRAGTLSEEGALNSPRTWLASSESRCDRIQAHNQQKWWMCSEPHFLITEHTFFCSAHGTRTRTHQVPGHTKNLKQLHTVGILK